MTRRVRVGIVGAPHGVRGELRVKPLTEDPLALKLYSPLETADGKRRFEVAAARLQGDMLVVRFKGIVDRDTAAALTHTELYVPRARLPRAEPGEYYHADLIGLRVETVTGESVGEIVAVRNFGAGDLFEVARPGRDSVYVPFTDAFVPQIDLDGGRALIDPPAGLLDDAAENLDEERG